ncbi:MAG: glycerol-3-phosphate acyltransferase [Candidatus Thorarchaeota archaeon]
MGSYEILIGIVSIIIGYLLGSLLPAYIFGKLKGVDIRKEGTKNAGTSNAYTVLGLGYAIPTGFYDFFKGLLAILIADNLGASFIFMQISGIAAILGHVFPFYIRFRGGQGAATASGIMFLYLIHYFSISREAYAQLVIVFILIFIILFIFMYISRSGSTLPLVIFPLFGYSVFIIFPTSGFNLFFAIILIHMAIVGVYKIITQRKLVITDEEFLASWWRVAIRPASLLFLVFYFIFSPTVGILLIGIVTSCFIFLDLSRFLSKQTQELLTMKVKAIFRKNEQKRFSSMTIFLISTFIMVFIFSQLMVIEIAIIALVFLVFGDLFAKIFGLAYGRHKIFYNKTLEGSLAYIGVIIICCYILYTSIDISLPVLIIGAVAAPIAEVLPLGMNDNFTVPIICGTAMYAAIFFGL